MTPTPTTPARTTPTSTTSDLTTPIPTTPARVTLAVAGGDDATGVLGTTVDGRFRVRLVPDKEARNPRADDTSLVHVITIDTYHGRNLPVDKGGGPLAAVWERLKFNRWKGVDTFTRYVAIMHGGIVLESAPQGGPRSLWYVTGEEAAAIDGGLLTEAYVQAEMDDYEAWHAGDVFSYIVEERISSRRDDDPDDAMQPFEHVDSCTGLSTTPYVQAQAREALTFYASRVTASAP
ncbi:hypothetical protein [Streptomyces chartreusis]|uniref:hypothetical protein n=1 Tax=Streptomyces chartreusis TaxID=1969 RepID=UPI0034114F7D